MDTESLEVHNNTDEKRFEIKLGEQYAFAEYMIHGPNIIFTHTEVPPEYEGQGVGAKLARHALEYAKNEGYKVQPLCPFIKSYVLRHPEYKEISWGL